MSQAASSVATLADGLIDPAFWRGRRVLVTGHTGFKGSWLLLLLERLGAVVTGFSLPPPTEPAMFALLGLERGRSHVLGNINDRDAVLAAVRAAAPEIVLHMAAQPLVRESYAIPVETFAANVIGTAHVLEACRQVSAVRTIVAITTDKVYENLGLARGYTEEDRLGGHDPYSSSKAAAELVVASYRASFFAAAGVGLAAARSGNVVGGGDFAADRIVPDAIRAFVAGEPLRVRNRDAVRPWQHVLDPLAGYLLLAERLHRDPALAGGWNFGPPADEAVPVGRVAELMCGFWPDPAEWTCDPGPHPHEAHLLTLDPGKAARLLGWRQRLGIEETLRLTVEWYDAWRRGADIAAVSHAQAERFLAHVTA